jgi:hypothetical protein
MPEFVVTRILSLAFVLVCVPVALAADDPIQPILDLHKSGKLFDKSEYKSVRAAAARVFQTRMAPIIKDSFAADNEALAAWLDKNKEIKEEFFCAIDEQRDDVPRVLEIFRELWKDDQEAVAKYPNLAIAISVVWDNPKALYDYRGHQVRTKSKLPADYLKFGPRDEFKYHVTHAKAIQAKEAINRYEVLPWEFLVYVIDHRTPVEEREWAIKNYIVRRPMIGKIYQEIEYDKVMLETKSEVCKLNGHDYTLPDIKKYGGVCAMQADFAARVGKSLAVPAAYVGGQSQDLGLHAWVMWVEVLAANKSAVKFKLESWGRYRGDNYYTGELTDPQTGEEILDRDMERRLSAAATDRLGKRQSDLAMEYFKDVSVTASLDGKKKVQYLLNALKLSVFNEPAWLELARMARSDEVGADMKSFVLEQTERLLTAFAQYPDFTWKVAGDLLTLQKDKLIRNRFYERLVLVYEAANRPDLSCEARLKWAEFLGEEKKWALAATGLAQSIKKFPDEGRYVPRMLDKLTAACGEFSGGKEYLSKTYLELLRKMNPRRGDEVTKYFIKTSGDALAFFQGEKKTKEAAEVERIRRSAGLK